MGRRSKYVTRDLQRLEPDLKCGTFPWVAVDGNAGAMRVGNPLRNGQAEAGSTCLTARRVCSKEPLENPGNEVVWNSDPIVSDAHQNIGSLIVNLHGDAPTLRCVFDCIVQQCPEEPAQCVRLPFHQNRPCQQKLCRECLMF